MLWIALEVNTLRFCCLFYEVKKTRKDKFMGSPFIKYFIVQSAASAIVIVTLMINAPESFQLVYLTMVLAILMKLGAVPLHRWFIEVTKKLSHSNNFILISWQKLAPIYILIPIKSTMIIISLVARGVIGSLSQYITSKVVRILAFSSVFNLSWMLIRKFMGTKTIITFIILYWIALLAVFELLKKNTNKSLEDVMEGWNSWKYLVGLASLAGIPPFIGFVAKLQLINSSKTINLTTIVLFLLLLRAINLYIYMRMFLRNTSSTPIKTRKGAVESKRLPMKFLIITNIPALLYWGLLHNAYRKDHFDGMKHHNAAD
jgi:NADH:ubiquinone oxidoreductase subunit 2 (subunit N)